MASELSRQCKKALKRWHYTSEKIAAGRFGVAQANKAERHMHRVCGTGTDNLRARVGYYNKITGRTKYYGKANS